MNEKINFSAVKFFDTTKKAQEIREKESEKEKDNIKIKSATTRLSAQNEFLCESFLKEVPRGRWFNVGGLRHFLEEHGLSKSNAWSVADRFIKKCMLNNRIRRDIKVEGIFQVLS